ncbi:MAG TPA: isoprenylcysteine carboxylmethyltransferase family protein [Thermoplasmata archaeon]|nr:isoprenylcysteine carboxylmethyltransferase family protein [Thermoplasmata archaeon]
MENPIVLVWGHLDAVLLGALAAAVWIGGEYLSRRATFRLGAPRRPSSRLDRGTYPIIAGALGVAMVATLVAFLTGVGGYLPLWTAGVGLALVVLGVGFRGWALRTLGRFFTMPITLPADQEIVRGGPYQWIRHPAYTGGLLTAMGMPLVLGTTVGFLVTFAVCLASYVYRIHFEEQALVGRFGDRYREYAKRTWRLLPGLY